MKIIKKDLKNSEVQLEITIPWKDWSKFFDKAIEDISKDVKIEGFRPGKAPKNMVEKKVGKEIILNNAAEKAIRESYAKALEKEKINAIDSPQVDIMKLAEGNELEFKVITTVMPEVKMNAWKDAVKKANKENRDAKIEVDQKDIDAELEKLANSRTELDTVERIAKDGDSVEIDFDVFQSGVLIEGGSSKKHNLVLGSNVFIPGFEEKLVGAKAGDEKEFELSFPKEYHATHLAGKPATFKVKVNAVQERKIPKIDDEFAKSLGKFETLKDLRDVIEKGMKDEKEFATKEKKRNDIVEELIKKIEVTIPKVLVDGEIQKMLYEFEGQIQGMGMTMDQYLEQIKKTRQDLEKNWMPQAEKRIKSALALEEVAKEEEIEVSSEEVEAEMNKTLQMYKNIKDAQKNIDMARLYNYTKGMLQNQKVFEMLEKL
ncbi:MAG: trigger factor [Candidatus Moranbacteria bacterium]|nr:trigger factor [Candidatus Moranbacteria bacterium]